MASRCLLESVGIIIIPVRSTNGRVKYAGRKGPRFLDAKTDLLSHLRSVSWGTFDAGAGWTVHNFTGNKCLQGPRGSQRQPISKHGLETTRCFVWISVSGYEVIARAR